MTTEWTDDLMAGVTGLAVAESRIREIAHLASKASTGIGCTTALLGYGYVDRADLKALQDAATDIMFQADELAAKLGKMRKEAVQ